ncbi:MAG: pseudouridine synthase [Gammaproteobacteria bacterium]|jgi:23S rRNA pseudouridine2605 synthase|nr:pseudouridine synthase [Gammaproteobacteria bacterium]MBQ0774077.1 pseudouridine synthase [Gammaproteobacteria bacterium]
MSEKLQKVLARCGLGSRRELEGWIEQGRVSVNGKLATLGDRVEGNDTIRVDGRIIKHESAEDQQLRVIMYHKPAGEVCSRNDPEGRKTVFDNLPILQGMRWVQVGRLDLNTSGLLLFTTDGELAHRMMHPSNGYEREYAVRVRGEITKEKKSALLDGVLLEDGVSKFESVIDAGGAEEAANHWYRVVLKGGKYREVRRLFESQELEVARLIRIRFGSLTLPAQLKTGRWMDLSEEQLKQMSNSVTLKGKQYTGLYGRARLRNQTGSDKLPRTARKTRNPPRR